MRMQWPWSLTLSCKASSSLRQRKSLIVFFRYGGFERRVKTNASTSLLQALRCNHVTDENILLSAIHTFFTFHRVVVMKVMKELIVSWQFDCAENDCFSFSFLLLRGKREVLFHWFVEHKKAPVCKVTCSGNWKRRKHKRLGSESAHHTSSTSYGCSRDPSNTSRKTTFIKIVQKLCYQHFILGERYIQGYHFTCLMHL